MTPLIDTNSPPSGDMKAPSELVPQKRKRGRPPKPKNPSEPVPQKRKRGRPPKPKNPADLLQPKRKPGRPSSSAPDLVYVEPEKAAKVSRLVATPKKQRTFGPAQVLSHGQYYTRNLATRDTSFLTRPALQAIAGHGEPIELSEFEQFLAEIRNAAQVHPNLFAPVAWCSFPFFPKTAKNFRCMLPYCPWCTFRALHGALGFLPHVSNVFKTCMAVRTQVRLPDHSVDLAAEWGALTAGLKVLEMAKFNLLQPVPSTSASSTVQPLHNHSIRVVSVYPSMAEGRLTWQQATVRLFFTTLPPAVLLDRLRANAKRLAKPGDSGLVQGSSLVYPVNLGVFRLEAPNGVTGHKYLFDLSVSTSSLETMLIRPFRAHRNFFNPELVSAPGISRLYEALIHWRLGQLRPYEAWGLLRPGAKRV